MGTNHITFWALRLAYLGTPRIQIARRAFWSVKRLNVYTRWDFISQTSWQISLDLFQLPWEYNSLATLIKTSASSTLRTSLPVVWFPSHFLGILVKGATASCTVYEHQPSHSFITLKRCQVLGYCRMHLAACRSNTKMSLESDSTQVRKFPPYSKNDGQIAD